MKAPRNFADDIRQLIANDPELKGKVEEAQLSACIAQLVCEARLAAGMTQVELAHKAHTGQSAICRIEDPDEPHGLSVFTLLKIAKALGQELQIEFVAPKRETGRDGFKLIAYDSSIEEYSISNEQCEWRPKLISVDAISA